MMTDHESDTMIEARRTGRTGDTFDAAADALDPNGVFIDPQTAIDLVLDADSHDCMLHGSDCYLCAVQRAQAAGWRV
jgi:hypothetical protein